MNTLVPSRARHCIVIRFSVVVLHQRIKAVGGKHYSTYCLFHTSRPWLLYATAQTAGPDSVSDIGPEQVHNGAVIAR